MIHKYVSEDGSLKELGTEESNLFDKLIHLMMNTEDNFDAIEVIIKQNPILVKAVHGQHGYTALALATDMQSYKGWCSFKELLQKGADIYFKYQGQTLMQKVIYSSNIMFSNKYKHIAYDYADNDAEKAELNLLRCISEQESRVQTVMSNSISTEAPIVVKESGGECCIVSMLIENRYHVEIYNHPKFSAMLKAAKDLGVLSDFMSVLDDDYFAEQLPIAIEEKKQELINYQRSMGANEDTLKEIDSAIEDLSIEQVLSELYSANERPQEKRNSFEEFFYDVANSLKLLALNGFITLKSGHVFYHGLPGGVPDDFSGNSGGAGIQFEQFPSENSTAQMVLLTNYSNLEAITAS